MAQNCWEADTMLDVYIYDYLVKRKLHATAKAFQAEGKISTAPVAIDAPGGFLFEWWSVFWDIFIARTNGKQSEAAASYIETQRAKAQEVQQTLHQLHQKPQQLQQQQLQHQQQLLVQRHALQQQQKQQQQQHQGDGSQLLNGASILLGPNNPLARQNSAASALEMKMYEERMELLLQRDSPDDAATKKKIIDNVSQLVDPTRKSMSKSSQLSGQSPWQSMHGPLGSMSGNLQHIRYQNQQLLGSGKDVKSDMNSMMSPRAAGLQGSLIGVPGSNQGGNNLPLEGWPLTQLQHKQLQQQYLQQTLSGQSQQQDKMIASGCITMDSISNVFQGNEQTLKSQIGQKRKQPVYSSGPANSPGTANTSGPSPSSLLSPLTHTPGDTISMSTLPDSGGSSKSLLMFDSDGMGSLTSASNQLFDMDNLVNDGALEDNVESYLSHEDPDPMDRIGRFSDVNRGFTFTEIQHIPASTSKIESCHFSSDGKILATAGHDRKAVLWCTESFSVKSTLEEHSQWITDVRFSPSMSRIATSSADKTVRVWDADKPGFSLRTFTGHSTAVMSLDFHPGKEDLICSCDNNSEIRYWSIKNGSCAGVLKVGASQLRFQPRFGRLLAAAAGNFISVLDVESQVCRHKLQGHKNLVHSVCWDSSGEYLASASDDTVRIWTVSSAGKGDCIHELSCSGNKFHSCVFHPSYPSLLIIGCYETLELWNFAENKTMTLHGHDKLISSLASSSTNGLVASASHDKCVKLWK